MTLFFMHITKTAGGSLKSALRKSDADVRFHYPHEPEFRADFRYEGDPDIIFGHYHFGVHEHAGRTPRYACFLREPAARMISHYHHLLNNDRGPVGNRLRTFPTMRDYLTKARHWEFDNFLCRLIAGTANKPGHGNVGYNTYVQARENLRHFEFIGLFEDMAGSLERLKTIVPSLDTNLPTVNKGAYGPEIDDADYRLVESLTGYDRMLYDDAARLVEIAAPAVMKAA